MGSVDIGMSKVCVENGKWAIESEDEEGLHFGRCDSVRIVVCNYGVWQYREEGIAEGSGRV